VVSDRFEFTYKAWWVCYGSLEPEFRYSISKISGFYHRDTENTEVWGNIAILYDVAS
jgi:hypothetical protein